MADIELVIKIPKDVYTRLFDNGIQDNEIATNDICEMARALRLGTPLPKGHGRLIDADALADKLQEVSVLQRYEDVKIDHRCTIADVLTSLTHDLKGTALLGYEICPTIIEADKEEK